MSAVVQMIVLLKPFRARAVLQALQSTHLLGMTIREVRGYGRQKHRLQGYLGSEYDASFVPKVQLTLFVDDEHAAGVSRTVVTHGRTGRMGDGKILILPCEDDCVCW